MKNLKIEWRGPYGWPKLEGDLPSIPKPPGVYLWTVEYQTGYLIYLAGYTRRPMQERFREHTRKYMNGFYNVLNIAAMQKGERKKVWQGFWTQKRSLQRQKEYDTRRVLINEKAHKQLAGFRVFVANIGTRRRILERLEAAIMKNLDSQPEPFCNIPDEGMMLAPRWKLESPIIAHNKCAVKIHCLPACLEI